MPIITQSSSFIAMRLLFPVLTNIDGITRIHDVQGESSESPLINKIVTVEAVVIGYLQTSDADNIRNLRGFFLQEEDTNVDSNPGTSEGIFVFQGGSVTADGVDDFNVDGLVRVKGTAAEYIGKTKLTSMTSIALVSTGNTIALVSTGNTIPPASVIDFPATGFIVAGDGGILEANLEQYEGMLVYFYKSK
jgi:predicted extracellular nuclease